METVTLKNGEIISRLPDITQKNLNDEIKNLRFIGGGSYGKVFKGNLSDSSLVVIKVYRKKGMEISESNQLKILAKNTRVNMPEVYFTYSDNFVSVMAMSYIKGKNVLSPEFLLKNKNQKINFAQQVVTGMMDWHTVTNNRYGSLENPNYDSWLDFYRNTMVIPRLCGLKELCSKGQFNKRTFDLLCEATDMFFNVANEPEKPVLIHGDLNIMNIMAEPRTLELTGFIDPCGAMWADREYDLFQLQSMWGNRFGIYETYKNNCKLSDYCDFKVAYYGALHEASMRLNGGLIFPLWEELCNNRLKKEMSKLK